MGNIIKIRKLNDLQSVSSHVYFHVMNILFFIVVISIFISVTAIPHNIDNYNSIESFEISLDCEKINGKIHNYGEINCGPLPNHDIKIGEDLTEQYQEIGIKLIRTHDFSGPTDVSTIYPDWEADPLLESSYDFESSDTYITSIINANCDVFYRLGESASANKSLRNPPLNFSKWAEICKHIVMHYNEGWNNGFFYNIAYWEIWNEPDITGFWNGSAQDYYNLYNITVLTLKSYNNSLKIGGPCTSSLTNINYTTGFLSYLKENELPLDFFSWHQYADTPNELYQSSCYIRDLLDSYGFSESENINTEWNINILTPQRDKDNAKNAAFTTCSHIVFHDAELDHALRYRGTQDPSWLMRFIGLDLSLFAYNGEYKKPALSHLALNHLTRDTPIRLNTPEMDASNGITYLAGISEDKTNIFIIISNFNTKKTSYNLEVSNLSWNSTYTAVYYNIDAQNNFKILEETNENLNTYNASNILKRNSIHFIRLTNSSSIPDEGPNTTKIPFLLQLRILDPFTRLLGIFLIILIFG